MTIDEKIDEVLRILKAWPTTGGAIPAQSAGAVADDADLDGQYGNEKIRKMPSAKYWQGADYTDAVMSDCPADFLKAYAKYKGACAYMTRKNGDPEKLKYAGYDDKSAARALGWAARNEGKKAAPKAPEGFQGNFGEDDGMPF